MGQENREENGDFLWELPSYDVWEVLYNMEALGCNCGGDSPFQHNRHFMNILNEMLPKHFDTEFQAHTETMSDSGFRTSQTKQTTARQMKNIIAVSSTKSGVNSE